nr:nadh dehydrogenase [ubiquinone] 1 beta subcomplex subunit 10-b [Quercus suber]
MGRKKGLEFDESPPDDFDPSNPYKDPVAMLEMREYLVREKWIEIEKAKIIREKLKWSLTLSFDILNQVQRWLSRLSLTDSRHKLFKGTQFGR